MMKISLSLDLGRSYLTWKEKNKFYFLSWLKHEEIERFSISLEWTGTTSEWASQVVLVVRNLPANAGDVRKTGLIPGSGRSPGKGSGNPLQYSCLKNPMDRGAWPSCRVTKIRHNWSKLAHGTSEYPQSCFSWNLSHPLFKWTGGNRRWKCQIF